ncbi:ribbon-helix-helix protein, CopG family [Actinomadura sp. WMMB 499]|uniref:ribbon-helix-helix protein, CopG family n=1 Tax=Actinomadura sp. WMMB 499 TaxID=1219491 RepID=UPI0012489903|nr:ribbon-helix-helix protein, CopG family [Actinomadura sp. WMMB 499]QFG24348.1 ribbon-helix-helix protein, CopG family [Actinomadura sp. WMMB 499]
MVIRTVHIPDELDAKLVELAAADRVSVNTAIVRALETWLESRRRHHEQGREDRA